MEKKKILLRSILTAATMLLLALLAWHCLDIYRIGNSSANLDENGLYIQPVFRADDVITRLGSLRIWAIGYLALLIGVCLMAPGGIRKGRALPMDPSNRLRLMKMKFTDLPEAARAEESLRRKVQFGTGAVVILCAVMSLIFLLNRDHFLSWDLEKVMGRMLINIVPWIFLAFAAVIAASFLFRRSTEREINILKGIPGTKVPVPVSKTSVLNPVRMILYVLAVVLVVTGICNGGMRDVLVKAINICTECIGLG